MHSAAPARVLGDVRCALLRELADHAVDKRLRLVGAREQQDIEQVLLGKVTQFRHAGRAARVENLLESGAAEQAVPLDAAHRHTRRLKIFEATPAQRSVERLAKFGVAAARARLAVMAELLRVVEVVVTAHAVHEEDEVVRRCTSRRRERRRCRDGGWRRYRLLKLQRAQRRHARVDHVAPGVG